LAVPDLEPYARHRRPSSEPPRGMRWRFLAAIILMVLTMIAVGALIVWLPIVN
jgi:hypothetical protein